MAIKSKNLTNQKLYFAGEQLAKLQSTDANAIEMKSPLYQAQIENCLSHLYFCYRALILEISGQLKIDFPLPVFQQGGFVEQIDTLKVLLAEQDSSSPELMRLNYLATDKDSWLHLLIKRYEQGANGNLVENTPPAMDNNEGNKLHLIEIKGYNEAASDFLSLTGELQTIYHELKMLVDEVRESLVEY